MSSNSRLITFNRSINNIYKKLKIYLVAGDESEQTLTVQIDVVGDNKDADDVNTSSFSYLSFSQC